MDQWNSQQTTISTIECYVCHTLPISPVGQSWKGPLDSLLAEGVCVCLCVCVSVSANKANFSRKRFSQWITWSLISSMRFLSAKLMSWSHFHRWIHMNQPLLVYLSWWWKIIPNIGEFILIQHRASIFQLIRSHHWAASCLTGPSDATGLTTLDVAYSLGASQALGGPETIRSHSLAPWVPQFENTQILPMDDHGCLLVFGC